MSAESRSIRSNNDVARRDDFTATAKRSAIDDCDHRLRNLFELTENRVKRVEHLVDRVLNMFLDRHARTKRATVFVGSKDNRHNLATR